MMQMRGLFRKSQKQAQLLLIYAPGILIMTYLQDFSNKQQENYFYLSPLIGALSLEPELLLSLQKRE